jgi:hypothetical protein
MFDLIRDSGVGNLNLRAFLASLVGPRRIVHGGQAVKRVPEASNGSNIQLYKSTGTGQQATYVEVWLPQSSIAALPGGGAFLAFFSSKSGIGEASVQILLSPTQRFSVVLLDDDALYAGALTDAAGGALAAPVPVVVSSVVF